MESLEAVVATVDPAALREEIARLASLINKAKQLEASEVETKVAKLREVLTTEGVFSNPSMKLLLFTEHKDTLDYLAGDGKDGRPLGKLVEWGLSVTQIHGGMKIGDRDAPGTRLYSERAFKEETQVLVATEAAGEGINLQFCWFMINYDIPWNPVRLEQRMGRIHRYGQEHDCLIYNFVAINTREGRVLRKLLDRLREIRKELGTDQVFDVVGEIFPSNQLERLFRDLYARRTDIPNIEERIVRDVSLERFKAITDSALEGLAKRELNLSAIVGRSAEAKERRLVPEVIEQFFLQAAPLVGVQPKPTSRDGHVFRIGRIPRSLISVGQDLEPRFGRLGREYQKVVFDKGLLASDPALEWVTPGHPLFEAVRTSTVRESKDALARGAIFYDLNRETPAILDIFGASINDGRGNTLHRRLFVVESSPEGQFLREPTVFLDFSLPKESVVPPPPSPFDKSSAEQFLLDSALKSFLAEVSVERSQEIATIARHVDISLNALIDRQQLQLADYLNRQVDGQTVAGLDGLIAQAEGHLDELNNRLDARRRDLELERHCTIADVVHLGRGWVLPHPDRESPEIRPLVRDDEIEKIAVRVATEYEEARGWKVESVEAQNRGFDLISRRPHPEDPQTFIEVKFIEVKGRAGIGELGLTSNEYHTAERLRDDYWLYAVFNCGSDPTLYRVHDPSRLGWRPVVQVEHYHLDADAVVSGANRDDAR